VEFELNAIFCDSELVVTSIYDCNVA
jgi:hypothetical protein